MNKAAAVEIRQEIDKHGSGLQFIDYGDDAATGNYIVRAHPVDQEGNVSNKVVGFTTRQEWERRQA